MRESLLSVRGLTKNFGALRATDGIDFEVREGETHAVIGPNGAGKTTFISQLAGNLRPDSGSVRFAGTDITALADVDFVVEAIIEDAHKNNIKVHAHAMTLRDQKDIIRAGADLLVHEVASPESFQRAGVSPERAKQVIAHHVTPEQAGEVFAKTKPRLAVYSHIVQADASEEDLIPPTRRTYSGAVEVGEDLMVILVGEKVEVRRPRAAGRSR